MELNVIGWGCVTWLWTLVTAYLISVQAKPRSGNPLTDLIRHYEPLFYDHVAFYAEHHRTKRDTQNILKLNLHAHGRPLHLDLQRDPSVFHQDLVIEDSHGAVHYDTSSVYTGTLKDDPTSSVYGLVTRDGLFEGHITSSHGRYVIERSSRYFNTTQPFHSVIYRHDDVIDIKSETDCNSDDLHSKMYQKQKSDNKNKQPKYSSVKQPLFKTNVRLKPSNLKVNVTDTKWRSGRRKRDVASSWQQPFGPEEYDRSGGISHSYLHQTRKKEFDPARTTCTLYMQADHLFYEHYQSNVENVIEQLTQHVQGVNEIYKKIDFDENTQADQINFIIKRIKVHTDPNARDYKFRDNYGVELFLELFSEDDFNSFCLAYMFTYRDFEGGTLGLAWTGDMQNAGGVCEKNGQFRGSLKSLNSGIVTILNYGKDVPSTVSHVTMAHEIGHNMGSQHDPEEKTCSPGGDKGNYIMFARATSGDKPNNNKFSHCSQQSMARVMEVKARHKDGCFIAPTRSICGNGVVEEGEQCDCGWEDECTDSCCYPQTSGTPNHTPCRLRPGARCSPSQGPCCTSQCSLVPTYSNTSCRESTSCKMAAKCDGYHPECPASRQRKDKTKCDENSVCYQGECTGSVCLAYGLESCQCEAKVYSDFSDKNLCQLCCKKDGHSEACRPSYEWNRRPYDIPDLMAKPGSPCNKYRGYCDVSHTCREVNPSGPLANLKKLIFSEQGMQSLRDWLNSYWYVVLTAGVAIVVFMILFIKLCAPQAVKKAPSAGSVPPSSSKHAHDRVRGPLGTYTWFYPSKTTPSSPSHPRCKNTADDEAAPNIPTFSPPLNCTPSGCAPTNQPLNQYKRAPPLTRALPRRDGWV